MDLNALKRRLAEAFTHRACKHKTKTKKKKKKTKTDSCCVVQFYVRFTTGLGLHNIAAFHKLAKFQKQFMNLPYRVHEVTYLSQTSIRKISSVSSDTLNCLFLISFRNITWKNSDGCRWISRYKPTELIHTETAFVWHHSEVASSDYYNMGEDIKYWGKHFRTSFFLFFFFLSYRFTFKLITERKFLRHI